MLLAEEFLLLCFKESGRRSIAREKIDPALGGALLVELALAERISVTPKDQGWSRRGRVTITSVKPTDDPVLDDALSTLTAAEGRKVKDMIHPMSRRRLTRGLRMRLLAQMAASGVLTERRGQVLGLFPMTLWQPAASGAETELRERLRSALVDGLTPTERTVALIALLHATGHVARAVPAADKKLVRQRARALAKGDWVAELVKSVLDDSAATPGVAG